MMIWLLAKMSIKTANTLFTLLSRPGSVHNTVEAEYTSHTDIILCLIIRSKYHAQMHMHCSDKI